MRNEYKDVFFPSDSEFRSPKTKLDTKIIWELKNTIQRVETYNEKMSLSHELTQCLLSGITPRISKAKQVDLNPKDIFVLEGQNSFYFFPLKYFNLLQTLHSINNAKWFSVQCKSINLNLSQLISINFAHTSQTSFVDVFLIVRILYWLNKLLNMVGRVPHGTTCTATRNKVQPAMFSQRITLRIENSESHLHVHMTASHHTEMNAILTAIAMANLPLMRF